MIDNKKIRDLVKDVFKSNDEYSLTQKFEEEFCEKFGVKYAVSINSATSGLHAALASAGVSDGDEVIQPSVTVVMDSYATLYLGATPVYVDINPDTWNIDAEQIEKSITEKTKAIIAVHLFGNPANMREIKKIIRNKDIKLIEDCAQAHGSRINNKHVGNFGDVATFSFFPGKNLGAFGDGGGIVTNSKTIAEYCLRAKAHGALIKYDHNRHTSHQKLF